MKKIAIFIVLITGLGLILPKGLGSANLTSSKDTLQTSRFSWSGALEGTYSVGDTLLAIKTSGQVNNSTTGLLAGDTVTIGSNSYTVRDIIDSDEFTITSGLQSGDTADGTAVYYKAYSRHSIDVTNQTAVSDGAIRYYIYSELNTAASSDGAPDGGANAGFDMNGITGSNITCPVVSGLTFTDPVATRSGDMGGAGEEDDGADNYHTFLCSFSGDLASGGLSGHAAEIGDSSGTGRIINPAIGTSHTAGAADTFIVKVELLDSMANNRRVLDSVKMKVATVESVRVTASVEPYIALTICGADTCNDVEPGDTVDGETLSSNSGATSTATSVALATLIDSSYRLQAQKISISTNGASGYALTAFDDGNLRKGSDDIDDNVTPPTSPQIMNDATENGEEYGIHPSGDHVNTTTWGSGGTAANKYSGTDTSNILTLASNSAPCNSTATYVTYKATIDAALTAQGDYAHVITYVATAIF